MSAGFVCPRCRLPLEDIVVGDRHALKCPDDGASWSYPYLAPGIAVLLDEPLIALARAAIDARAVIGRIDDTLGYLRALRPETETQRRRYDSQILGESANRDALRRALDLIAGSVTTDALLEAGVRTTAWDRYASDAYTLLAYLRRDWGRRAESEAELAAIVDAIREQLRSHAKERRTAVVLGGGFGRIAHELGRDFEQVVALDSSIVIAALYALLREGPLAVYEVNVANARDHSGNAIRTEVRFDEPQTGLRFAVADASATPIADGSVDAILSAFFSDVVPLSRYASEARRMLRPGGIFVHFGPLGYHFTEREEQYSADEFMEALAAHGFRTHEPAWVGSTLLKSAARLDEARFDNLCFAATRVEG